jgi:predicted MFS family arabinose efflux permease
VQRSRFYAAVSRTNVTVGLKDLVAALGEPRFRLLFAGRAISDFGDKIVPVALAFAVLELESSASALGLVFAARMIPMVVLVLVGGVWADRLPRNVVMLTADGVRATTQTIAAVLLLTGRAEIWHLMVLMAVYGAAQAFFDPASTGLVPQTISRARLQQANGLLQVSRSTSNVVGPAVAGLLVATAGAGWAFAVDAATFVVSAAFLAALRIERESREVRTRFVADLVEGWREFASRTWVWASVAHFAFFHLLVLAPFWVLTPIIAKEQLGGASAYATILSAMGIGSILGGLIALRIEPSRPLAFAFAIILFEVPLYLTLAAAAPVLLIAAFAFVGSMAMNLASTLWLTVLQSNVPEHALSRVSSYDWLGSLVFLPAGYMLAGPVAESVGIAETLVFAAVWSAASTFAILSLEAVRGVRRTQRKAGLEPATVLR